MAFTLSKVVSAADYYGALGIVDASSASEKMVDVTYEAIRLDSLIGTMARVIYTTRVGTSNAIFNEFEFEYSGTGNPLEEAETALQASLSD
ncbi:TPA: hypothetical protein R2K43_000805 [Raoultella planticola]|uniref:hypothetical protein n=1 Tax=Raoultella planticola TaxID=575 RepID=UPI000BA0F72C|nr:hypothetical protein [Raoultella planticola]OZP70419.1 hypothetical protein CIG23_29165 [Raoultella planticola]HEC2625648.1 hypothetical protein [Raoultella planticola]